MYHYSGRSSEVLWLPVYGGAADITEGSIIEPGTTADQDKGVYIKSAGAGATVPTNIVGLLNRLHDYSVVGDSTPAATASAAFVLQPVALVKPGDLICAEYDTTVQVDIASYSAPAVTITSGQDAFDGGWIYIPDDVSTETGIGQLGYIEESASETYTCRNNFTTAPDSTSDAVLIVPMGSLVVSITAGGVKLATYAAATNYVTLFRVIRNEFTYRGKEGWTLMQPQLHSNMQLSGLAPKFRAVGYLCDLAAASVD